MRFLWQSSAPLLVWGNTDTLVNGSWWLATALPAVTTNCQLSLSSNFMLQLWQQHVVDAASWNEKWGPNNNHDNSLTDLHRVMRVWMLPLSIDRLMLLLTGGCTCVCMVRLLHCRCFHFGWTIQASKMENEWDDQCPPRNQISLCLSKCKPKWTQLWQRPTARSVANDNNSNVIKASTTTKMNCNTIAIKFWRCVLTCGKSNTFQWVMLLQHWPMQFSLPIVICIVSWQADTPDMSWHDRHEEKHISTSNWQQLYQISSHKQLPVRHHG